MYLAHVVARFLTIKFIVGVANIWYPKLMIWKLSGVERSLLAHPLGPIAYANCVLVGMQESLGWTLDNLATRSHCPAPQRVRASDRAWVVCAPAFVARSKGDVAVPNAYLKWSSAEKEMNFKTTQRRTGPSSVKLPNKFVASPCSSCLLEGPEPFGANCEGLIERVNHARRNLALHFSQASLSKLHESGGLVLVNWGDLLSERLP